jgi:hypothetical protein
VALVALISASLLLVPTVQAMAEVSEIASSCKGSSDPTLYPNNQRLTMTQGGRLLGTYDPHGTGIQIFWRDPGGAWNTTTTGAVTNGFIKGSDINTDRPATIAVARDSLGVEHAWLVWGSYTFSKVSALKMRRLSNLDSPGGPSVGPEATLEAAGLGNNRPDVAFLKSGGAAAVTWTKRVGDSAYQLVAAWLTSLDTDAPGLRDQAVLHSSSNAEMTATLVPTSGGMSIVARADKFRLFRNDPASPSVWTKGVAGVSFGSKSKPSAIELASGEVLATGDDQSQHIVKAVKFSANGGTVSTLLNTGEDYARSALASDGTRAWVFMVRRTDTSLVSREMAANGSWGGDVEELPPGHDYKWPNTVRNVVGSIRLLVDGDRCPSSTGKNQVLYYEKFLGLP